MPFAARRSCLFLQCLVILVMICLIAGLSACSSDSSKAKGDTVKVEHAYGSSDLPKKPKKVVSLGPGYTDALLALGEEPAAIAGYAGYAKAVMPWDEGKLKTTADGGSVEVLRLLNPSDVPMEQIAKLEPDLILASSMATSQEIFDQLDKIAPTLPALKQGELDNWQDQTKVIGKIFDKEQEADRLIQDTEGSLSSYTQEFPAAVNKTIAVAFYGGPDNIQVVTDPNDITLQAFSAMGLRVPEKLIGMNNGEGGVQGKLSLENVDQMNADIVVVGSLTGSTNLNDSPLWQNMEAVKSNRVLNLDAAAVIAFRVPTILSIPWSAEKLKPLLASF